MWLAEQVLFLCNDAASANHGITLAADAGWFPAGMTGASPPATGIAAFLDDRDPAYRPEA